MIQTVILLCLNAVTSSVNMEKAGLNQVVPALFLEL